jgi:fructose-bisphosphate aldolase class I
MDARQLERIRVGQGFFAALDQSGGSTPTALAEYGINKARYNSDAEMFDLVHAMRSRVISDPAFGGTRILGAILFEQTMGREVEGIATGEYLWERKQIVPFLKVDKGLAEEHNHVQLMKPIDTLDDLLARASEHGMFGTKMRSVIKDADQRGVADVVSQQFQVAERIAAVGLVPILEPEVSISAVHKEDAETLLLDAIRERLDLWPSDRPLMLKLTIPTQAGRYAELAADSRVLRVLALSGGYSRAEACALLAENPSMTASFSRALLDGLTDQQTDAQFHACLDASIEQIFRASIVK